MTNRESIQRLKDFGYERSIPIFGEFSNNVLIEEDFSNQNANHTMLRSANIIRSNFDKASLTGSIFNECIFVDCSMYMPDLEYCKFYDCKFQSSNRKKFTASINNSSFIRTYFKKIKFYGCSFAESYFEECIFDLTKLEYSTLENTVYRSCEFIEMNFSNSNLQYSEWEDNTFTNCTMAITQPPFMIGGLEICAAEQQKLFLISLKGEKISTHEYITTFLPLLLDEYEKREEYFPVANIYIFQKNYVEAVRILKKGLVQAVSHRDFRMLKFYCKLTVHAKVFDSHTLHDFYHSICRLLPQDQNSNAEMHIYMKNIGEIKNILFQSSKRPSLHISFITNFFSKNADKVGATIERLFRMAKMNGENQCEVLLSENSPLLIDINVHGTQENIQMLLPSLVSLTSTSQLLNMYKFVSPNKEMKKQITEFEKQCQKFNITLILAEYYLENCQSMLIDTEFPYFYNGGLDREIRLTNLLKENMG